MVEHRLAKARVEGSNPFSRSIDVIILFKLTNCTPASLMLLGHAEERPLPTDMLRFVQCHQVAKLVFGEGHFFFGGGDLTESCSAI